MMATTSTVQLALDQFDMYEADLDESLNKRFDDVDKRLDALKGGFVGISTQLADQKTQLDDLTTLLKNQKWQTVGVVVTVVATALLPLLLR